MKTIIPLTALAALVASSTIHAQTPAYSKPSGYVTKSLSQGFNLVGLSLHPAPLASGTFETVNGTALTDSGVTYAPVAGRTYVLEITSGTLIGTIQEVLAASISGSTITTPSNLQTLGLTTSDTYALRLAPTLEEIFTTVPLASGGVLAAALSAGTADVVWVPTGTGSYDQYFLHSTTRAFRRVGTTTATPNVPLVYADGFLVQKRNTTAASLTVTGNVKTVGTNSVANQGFNLLSVVAPVGLNLFNAGLEDDLTAALSAGTADIVWVQQPDLTYIQYFRRSGSGAGWRVSGSTTTLTQAQAEAISLSSGFMIQRRSSASTNIDLNVPTGYSNL
jgi:hypothetical protein